MFTVTILDNFGVWLPIQLTDDWEVYIQEIFNLSSKQGNCDYFIANCGMCIGQKQGCRSWAERERERPKLPAETGTTVSFLNVLPSLFL